MSHNEIFKCVDDAQWGNSGFQVIGMTTGIFFLWENLASIFAGDLIK